jgi:hypothetical protein
MTVYGSSSFNTCELGAVIRSFSSKGGKAPAAVNAVSEVLELCFSVHVTNIGRPQQKSSAVATSRCSIRPQVTQ